MPSQFDPEIPNLFKGEFTEVLVNDPAIAGHAPNLVLHPDRPFEVKVSWRLTGTQVPLYLKALQDSWYVTVYAESMGPGPELKLAEGQLPKDTFTGGTDPDYAFGWTHTLQIPAGVLPEENPGGDISGVYLMTVTAFLNSDIGTPGFDIIGFNQGPMIKVENPI